MKSTVSVPASELPKYRDRTQALLRRYFRTALEVGRLPNVLGREFFRARVTSYTVHTFEDAVIFVHDIERCLQQLDLASQSLIARIVFQNYSYDEAAELFGCTWRTIANRFPRALDELTRMFLNLNLLELSPCQEVKNSKKTASS